MNKFLLSIFALTFTLHADDLPDVTLQPWQSRKTDMAGYESLSTPSGTIVIYGGQNYISADFGESWKPLAAMPADYLSAGSSAFVGGGYLRGYWANTNYQDVYGIFNLSGDRIAGYSEMATGGGLVVGIQRYSTYVSADKGAS